MRHRLRPSIDGLENKTLLSHVAAGFLAHHPVLQAEVQREATHRPSVMREHTTHKVRAADSRGYTFSTLDDPSAGTTGSSYGVEGTFVLGINDQGQISGNYGDAKYITHGLLESQGKYTTLDDPSAGTGPANLATFFFPGTDAVKANNRGRLVGFYVDENNVQHSFLESGGHYTTIDPPGAANQPGPSFTTNIDQAADINDRGEIVGGYTDASGVTHGYLLAGGQYITLNDPNGVWTFATGINDRGKIVGFYMDSQGVDHSFLLSQGRYTTLDDPSAGTGAGQGTFAYMINQSGQITGWYVDAEGATHGFVLSDGHYTTLDDPDGVGITFAEGINDQRQIVGFYFDSNGLAHGFLATPGNGR
jgi:probable HAF family extracellular repeat protein